MELISMVGQSLALAMGISALTLIVFMVGSVFYIRTKVKGNIYCYLLAANKQLYGYLLKPKAFSVTLKLGEEEKKFLIHPTKQFWSFWPPGFPRNVQEPVPTYMFCEGNAEPLDPFDRKAIISEDSLLKISDEAMLRQTWKDVRDSVGFKGQPLKLKPILIVLGVVAVAILLYFAVTNGVFA